MQEAGRLPLWWCSGLVNEEGVLECGFFLITGQGEGHEPRRGEVGVGQQGVLEGRFFLRRSEALLDPEASRKVTGSGQRNQFEHGPFYVRIGSSPLCPITPSQPTLDLFQRRLSVL
jgi:hypothetical protein